MNFKNWLEQKGIKAKAATIENFLDFKGVNAEDLDAKAAASNYDDFQAFMRKSLEESIESKASKEDIEALKSSISEMQEKQLGNLLEVVKTQGNMLNDMKRKSATGESAKPSMEITADSLNTVRETMKNRGDSFLVATKDGLTLETKADTTTASVVNNGLALDLPDVGQLATTRPELYTLLPKFTVPMNANGTVRYIDWDQATIVRAADMIAECGTFPESTAAWQTYTVSLKKVGDMIPWCDEFEYDDNFLMQELMNFLRTNVELVKADQILNGDGLGNNLAGVFSLVPTYVPVASGITDASIYDLIVKLREAIEANQGSKYRVDMACMNIADINKYKLKKDANNNYVMPPFYDMQGNRIDGLTVIEDNNVTPNTMFVGDRRFIRIYQQQGMGIEFGYINDDFSTGKKRARLYFRLLLLIRQADRSGFLQVTDIDAALVTLAS